MFANIKYKSKENGKSLPNVEYFMLDLFVQNSITKIHMFLQLNMLNSEENYHHRDLFHR